MTGLLLTGRLLVRVLSREPSEAARVSPPACGNAGREGSVMAQAAPAIFKIPTESPQPARGTPGRPAARAKAGRPAPGRVRSSGTGRTATRGGGEVIELEAL